MFHKCCINGLFMLHIFLWAIITLECERKACGYK